MTDPNTPIAKLLIDVMLRNELQRAQLEKQALRTFLSSSVDLNQHKSSNYDKAEFGPSQDEYLTRQTSDFLRSPRNRQHNKVKLILSPGHCSMLTWFRVLSVLGPHLEQLLIPSKFRVLSVSEHLRSKENESLAILRRIQSPLAMIAKCSHLKRLTLQNGWMAMESDSDFQRLFTGSATTTTSIARTHALPHAPFEGCLQLQEINLSGLLAEQPFPFASLPISIHTIRLFMTNPVLDGSDILMNDVLNANRELVRTTGLTERIQEFNDELIRFLKRQQRHRMGLRVLELDHATLLPAAFEALLFQSEETKELVASQSLPAEFITLDSSQLQAEIEDAVLSSTNNDNSHTAFATRTMQQLMTKYAISSSEQNPSIHCSTLESFKLSQPTFPPNINDRIWNAWKTCKKLQTFIMTDSSSGRDFFDVLNVFRSCPQLIHMHINHLVWEHRMLRVSADLNSTSLSDKEKQTRFTGLALEFLNVPTSQADSLTEAVRMQFEAISRELIARIHRVEPGMLSKQVLPVFVWSEADLEKHVMSDTMKWLGVDSSSSSDDVIDSREEEKTQEQAPSMSSSSNSDAVTVSSALTQGHGQRSDNQKDERLYLHQMSRQNTDNATAKPVGFWHAIHHDDDDDDKDDDETNEVEEEEEEQEQVDDDDEK
jgi:hypothetical protein